jgi:hypothetical protein
MTEKLMLFRNNIFIIQRYQKIIASSEKDIEIFVERMGITKKEFFRNLLEKYPETFKNYSFVNMYKKMDGKSWYPKQLLAIYEHLKNENNTATINEFLKIIKAIETDVDTSPYRIEWLHAYFMTKQKNFKSSYYTPDRWALDPNFMIHFYKLLFHAENFDLEAVV